MKSSGVIVTPQSYVLHVILAPPHFHMLRARKTSLSSFSHCFISDNLSADSKYFFSPSLYLTGTISVLGLAHKLLSTIEICCSKQQFKSKFPKALVTSSEGWFQYFKIAPSSTHHLTFHIIQPCSLSKPIVRKPLVLLFSSTLLVMVTENIPDREELCGTLYIFRFVEGDASLYLIFDKSGLLISHFPHKTNDEALMYKVSSLTLYFFVAFFRNNFFAEGQLLRS